MSRSDAVLVLVFLAMLFIPGMAVGFAARLSRWTAVAAAPLITYGVIAITQQVSVALGLSFGLVSVLVGTLVVSAVVLMLAKFVPWERIGPGKADVAADPGQPAIRRGRDELIIIGGIVLGTLLGAVTVLSGMGQLDAINQDWDASFHANAVRFILDTGNSDPGALSAIYPQDTFFYPNAWHAFGAVVVALSGGSIPALLGAQSIAVAGIAGLGLAALLRAYSARVALVATVPLLLASFSGFPIDVLWRGPLLPYAAGIALIPSFLLLFSDTLAERRPSFLVVTAIGAAGLLALQPATALTAAVFALFLVIARWFRSPSRIRVDVAVLAVMGVLAVLFGLTYVSGALVARGVAAVAPIDWPPIESPGQAVGELLFLNHAAQFPQYWLTVLLIVGLVALARLRTMWWFIAGAGVFAVLFVTTAAYNASLTESLTLPWWNDRFRFVAIVTLGLVVLAGHGLVSLADAAAGLARRFQAVRTRPPRLVFGAAVVAILAVVGIGSSGFYAPYNADRIDLAFAASDYVSAGERAGMVRLAELVQPGERVMNDPRDGSVWMYALHDIEPVFGHVVDAGSAVGDLSDDAQSLLGSFNCLDTDETVRRLVEDYDITYVFLGQGFLRAGFGRAPGLRGLQDSDSLDLVYNEDGVRIFEVDMTPMAPEAASLAACSPTQS